MLKQMTVLAAVVSVGLASQVGFAASEGMYLGGQLGVAVPLKMKVPSSGTLDEQQAKYKTGYDLSLNVGYKQPNIRYEGQLLYMRSKIKEFDDAGTSVAGQSGDVRLTAGMANVYYDFDDATSAFVPYIGAGLGFGYVKPAATAATYKWSGSRMALAYQAILGIGYKVDETTTLTMDYRYLGTAKVKFTATDVGGNSFGVKESLKTNLFNLGLICKFD